MRHVPKDNEIVNEIVNAKRRVFMSLVPYKEGSVILDDPSSQSLVIVHPSSGALEFFQQIHYNDLTDINKNRTKNGRAAIASFTCPQCGTELNPYQDRNDAHEAVSCAERGKDDRTPNQPFGTRIKLSRSYFQLLERNHRHYALQGGSAKVLPQQQQCFIPENLFIPGYFQKFFKTLSLLGRGARGSVYKVVHTIGDIELGVFALKKIPIGNDMLWFQKCIREVKALSSLTHRSANLITYNHVWLEMNTACGLVRTVDGKDCDQIKEIPCIFILQQYCSGGNLEDFIIKDAFQKLQDIQSSDERKKKFLYRRSHPNMSLGLSTVQIASIIRDVARGLQELHDIGLIHRDLKPSNCLLLETNTEDLSVQDYLPTIVIGDLGECQLNGESRTASGATGTLEYTAPEIIITGTGRSRPADYNEYTFASDMYSLGMICFFVVFGELPFQPQLEMVDLKYQIKSFDFNNEYMVSKQKNAGLCPISTEIFVLMERLLSRNVAQRPSAAEVVVLLDALLSSRLNENTVSPTVDIGEDLDILNSIPLDTATDSEELLPEVQDDASDEKELIVLNGKDIKPNANRSSPQRLKNFAYHSCCLSLTLLLLAITKFTTIPAYLALVLFGMSINVGLTGQKWIIMSLSVLILIVISGNMILTVSG